MNTYKYTAVNNAGKTVSGQLTAQNDYDLEERLSDQMGLTIIEYKQIKKGKSFFSKVSDKDLIMFCVHIEQLDRAGVPLMDSLTDIRDSIDSVAFKSVVADVYDAVRGGTILSEAMARHPDVFDNVFVGLVSAGEKTGKMSETFAHLSAHLRWSTNLKSSVKKAMVYPTILTVVLSAVITMMMMFVVPQLTGFLQEQGAKLPWFTILLIDTSAVFVNYWYLIFSLPIFGLLLLIYLYKKLYSFRFIADNVLLRLPIFGNIMYKIDLARFSHFFGIMFNSGMGVLDCLSSAKDVVGNSVTKSLIHSIMTDVSDGSTLTHAISAVGKFPTLVVRMFKVGEDSGNMAIALENVNYFYEREVDESVGMLVELIQPVLTVVMGLILFWIIAAVFGPIYMNFSASSTT